MSCIIFSKQLFTECSMQSGHGKKSLVDAVVNWFQQSLSEVDLENLS